MSLTRLIRPAVGLLCLGALAASPFALANTIHVPTDQPTIQAGINAANDGDTVLVAPGIYYENINFNGKAITVTSSGGAAATIIDGNAKAPVASFHSGEYSGSILSGFTLRNGSAAASFGQGGGGVYIDSSSPTILNNIIDSNFCNGIYVSYANAQIQGNTISNTLYYSPYSTSCEYDGEAITVFGASPIILGNTIETSSVAEGILLWVASGTKIQNNIIRQNHGDGITIVNTTGTVAVVQNLIYGNGGPGIDALIPSTSGQYGSPQQAFLNNTVTQNGASGAGSFCNSASQICLDGDLSGAIVANNILDAATSYPALSCSNPYNFTPLVIEHNDVFNSTGAAYATSTCPNQTGTNGNISADPHFNNISANNYHLLSTSPAIDTGQNSVLQTFQNLTGLTLSTDFDGNPRIQNYTGNGCIIDLGAYEYPGLQSNCGTAETLQSSLNPSIFGQSVTFTAQLSSSTGVPTGDVQFFDGGNILSTQTVSTSGAAAFTTSSLAIGTHTITANYQPSGTFSAANTSISQVVIALPITLTLTTSANPSIVYQSVPLTALLTVPASAAPMTSLSGTVTFSQPVGGGTFSSILGTAQVGTASTASITTTQLPLGTDSLIATFSGTATYNGVSVPASATSAPLVEIVNLAPTTLSLTATPSTIAQGQSVALTATIADAPSTQLPFGPIAFTEPATGALLGTQKLLANGTATLNTSALSVGTHLLLASYSGATTVPGAPIFGPSTSALVTVTVIQDDFAVAFTPPALTVETFHSAPAPFSLTSLGSFSDLIDLSCSNLPEAASCTFSGSPVQLSTNQALGLAVEIGTETVPTANLTRPRSRLPLPAPVALVALLPLMGLLARRSRKVRLFAAMFVALAALQTLSGCTWLGYAPEHTPPGTYTITLTGTGRTTGTTHSTSLTLTVTP